MGLLIRADELRSILHYDPITGFWTWLVNKPRARAGAMAGYVDRYHHRRFIKINGVRYIAARLAFLYMTGVWPSGEADHKNLNKSDDCWENLRDATRSQNMANKGKTSRNTSGLKGVWLLPNGKWKSQIQVNGKRKSLGHFDSKEAAYEAYCVKSVAAFGEFARSA